MAASEELSREWDEHASPFAIRWRTLMRSRRRLVDVGPVRDPELRRALAQHAATDAQRERVLKDAHLIETARCADQVVCSRDEHVRTDFRRLSRMVTQLARMTWVNPVRPDVEPLAWLRSGAAGDGRRLLSQEGAG
jgi:hypothetical protein